MNKNFDFDAAMSNTEDALALIETVQELLDPLTAYTRPGIEEMAELTRRAHMIDATLRAARDKAQDACAMYHQRDAAVTTVA